MSSAGRFLRRPTIASHPFNVASRVDDMKLLAESQECMLSNVNELAIQAKIEILKYDEMWIADTGASNHCSKRDKGATNVRKAELLT